MSVLGKEYYKMCNIYAVQLPMTISCVLTITHRRIFFFNNTAWKCSIRTVLPFLPFFFLLIKCVSTDECFL